MVGVHKKMELRSQFMKAIHFVAILASALSVNLAFSQDGGNISFKSTEVAKGLYMLEGVGGFAGGNLGLSVGPDGVILIDDSLPPLTGTMKAAISEITKEPVDYVVNTHVHGDHIGGNESMAKDGATIVAHDNIRKRMIEHGVPTGNGTIEAPKGALPVITFSDEVTFYLNDNKAQVIHVAHAHTDGDAIIHFTDADVIHTGDVMFNGLFPFIDLDSGGSVDGYIKAQEKVLSLAGDKTKIIPGHGPLASKSELEASVAMLKDGKKIISALVAKGMSADEVVAANPLEAYEKMNWQFITTERMVRTFYRDIKK